MSVRILLMFLAIATGTFGQSSPDWFCPPPKGADRAQTLVRTVGGVKLSIAYTPAKNLRGNAQSCKFRFTSSNGAVILKGANDFVEEPMSVDLDRDGSAEVVLETQELGSAHCGSLYIVHPEEPAKLLKTVENCPGPGVTDVAHDGPVIVMDDTTFWTEDEKFVPFMCHICAPRPTVYFRFGDGKLRNVSGEFVSAYDGEISETRAQLKSSNVKALLGTHDLQQVDAISRDETNRLGDTPRLVLQIVVDYLYSGREQQAWRMLREMWPAWDEARMRRWLLSRMAESRRRGTLAFDNH